MIDERERPGQLKRNSSYADGGQADSQPSRAVTGSEIHLHKPSLIFFGSGPVAAASLASLATSFGIEYVITKQAPRHHRGSVPVVELAKKLKLPILFANTRQELDDVISKLTYKSPVGVVVDYGVIMSAKVIDAFQLGIVNSHYSLLPEWRGADPITFTVLSGQIQTGVSLMIIAEKLDEGQLIAQEKLPVPESITTPELTDQLVEKSNQMLREYLPDYIDGKIQPYDQPHQPASYSRKLTKQDGIIDWSKPAAQIEREIRAFTGWPKSTATLAGKPVIITKAKVLPELASEKGRLTVACGKGALEILKLKPAGKREMLASEFLAGNPMS